MDKPISVGDLVVVSRPVAHCGCPDRLGLIFRVSEIRPALQFGFCSTCNKNVISNGILIAIGARPTSVALYRLKRIPPLDELEGEKDYKPVVVPLTDEIVALVGFRL